MYLEWLVDYKPGTLTAIARDENGKEIARDSVTTAGEPARVRLTKEEHVITADGKDLSYIHYEIVDEDGNVVPTANNLVHFNLHGQGQMLVWTMENKLAVNVIKLRKMVHGKEKPSMVKVLSL